MKIPLGSKTVNYNDDCIFIDSLQPSQEKLFKKKGVFVPIPFVSQHPSLPGSKKFDNRFFEKMSREETVERGVKVCGLTCCAMLIWHYLGKKISLQELLNFKDDTYTLTDPKTGKEKNITYYIPGTGRSHHGLTNILIHYKLKATPHRLGGSDQEIKKFFMQQLSGGNLCICSVGLGYNGEKSGHLVIVNGIYSDDQEYVLISDPVLKKSLIQLPFNDFLSSFSRNGIVVGKKTIVF